MPLFDLDYASSPTPSQASLRADATGAAIEYTAPARMQNLTAPIIYDQGFTIEYAIKPTIIGSRNVSGGDSRIVPSVHSHGNTGTAIFELGFDNWDNPGTVTDLLPAFTMLPDNDNYQVISERASILGEARGTTIMILGNTYHLLGTLDASGLCQIYVNGVLEGTASPDIDMVAWISILNESLANGSRTLRDVFRVGTRFLGGAFRNSANAGEATIDNVRFYDRHFTALEAALAASAVAFTPDTVAQDASAYGSTEDELANNPEISTGSIRLDAFWKPDGTRVWTGFGTGFAEEVREYDVSPAWGIQPGDWTHVVTQPGFTDFRSMWWSPDGNFFSWMRRIPSSNFRTHINDMSANPWSIVAFGAQTSRTVAPTGSGGTPLDEIYSSDGLRLWVHFPSGVTSALYEYVLTVPWDASTIVTPHIASFDPVPDTGTDIRTFAFSKDGTVLYAMDGQALVSWDLSPAFDITSASNFQTGPSILTGSLGIPRGLNYRDDNGDIFTEGDQNQQRLAWFRT